MTSSNVVPDSEGEDSLPDVQAAPRGGDTFDKYVVRFKSLHELTTCSNGARGPPGASILQARRKNVSARDIHLSKQQIEDSGVHMLSVPPMLAEIEDSVDLTYTNRFNKAEKYIRVMTEVSITKPEADSLDVLLATGPTNGRSYSVSATLDSSTSSEWRFGIINQADPHDRAQKKRQRMCYSFLLPVKKVLAHDEASGRLAAEKLCRIYVSCVSGEHVSI